jgi:hypothetical protein
VDDMCYDRRRAEACVGTREEPGTLTQGAPVFPGSSRLGIEPKCGCPIPVSMLRVNTRVDTQGDRTGGEERLNMAAKEVF